MDETIKFYDMVHFALLDKLVLKMPNVGVYTSSVDFAREDRTTKRLKTG
jgi:hypothetical protein